uniref:RRM domain-containing protein n=1 Tax=Meloidogyne hapla TaxID=6305 RepID=A0A1I8BRB8_MELHA
MMQNSQQDIEAANPGMNQQQQQIPPPPPPTNPQQQQQPFPQQQHHGHPPPDCTIWMGDLSPDWDAGYIREAFAQYGKDISNVKMVTTDQGARKATYCFVEFCDEEAARVALLDVNGKPLFGERYRSCRGAKVYRNEEGYSKEQGFVRFTSETDQQKALVEMNKQSFFGRELFLKLARPKTRGTGRFLPRGVHGSASLMGAPPAYPAPGFFVPNSNLPMVTNLPFGVGIMPGAPLSIATPYGTQLAPNHGMAGFGGMPTTQQFAGQPIFVGNTFQQNPFMQQQFHQQNLFNPGSVMPQMGMPAGAVYPQQQHNIAHVQPQLAMPLKPEIQPYYEDVEPLSAEEHNAILINSSGELLTSIEASRWGSVAFTPDLRLKELQNVLH